MIKGKMRWISALLLLSCLFIPANLAAQPAIPDNCPLACASQGPGTRLANPHNWPDAPGSIRRRAGSLTTEPVSLSSLRLVGANFPIAAHPDPTTGLDQLAKPAIACSGEGGDECLVVWQGYLDATKWDLYGVFISGDGTPSGDPFVISNASDTQGYPAVAYNPVAEEYLVVWHDYRNGEYWEIHAQRVSQEGQLLGDDLEISSGANDRNWPKVTVNSMTGEYFVVWNVQVGTFRSDWDIYAQRISADGNLIGDATPLVAREGDQTMPVVAYHHDQNQYLLVWEDSRDYSLSGWNIYGARFAADASSVGSETPICQSPGDQLAPTVAANGTDGYLVAWQDGRHGSANWDIYATRLSKTGNPMGGEFIISDAAHNQTLPVVAYAASAEVYLVAWEDDQGGTGNPIVYARRVEGSGTPSGEAFPLTANAVNYQLVPAVSGDDDRFCVVWQDGRSGLVDEIYGQYVAADGGLSGENFAAAKARHGQELPSIAAGVKEYLVTWMDYRNGTDYDIWGQRVNYKGGLSGDPLPIAVESYGQGVPDAAYNPTNREYLVVWHGLSPERGFDIYARRLTPGGTAIGDPLLISAGTSAASEGYPRVVYNDMTHEYLVAWHAFTANSWNIYAQRLDATGTPIGEAILISTEIFNSVQPAAGHQEKPQIAFNSTSGEYVVVWQDGRGRDTTGWDIYAQCVGPDGSLLGTNQVVCDASADQLAPDVAYDPQDGTYFCVWQDRRNASADWDIYSRWLSDAGEPEGPAFLIRNLAGAQTHPVVIYNAVAEEYLVAWTDSWLDPVGPDIYGQRVGKTQGLISSAEALSDAGGTQSEPAIACMADMDLCLIAWQDLRDDDWDIYGQRYWAATPLPQHWLNLTLIMR